ncbi:MAG: D-Ala-D-Ala carboxypeptidase family metallohydrolase [Verrucomicrobiales bacterium]|nr:D-Ala-D-Ala carboxypeptidase family metallohydrolase [Verrucomicrobiales bacterium]
MNDDLEHGPDEPNEFSVEPPPNFRRRKVLTFLALETITGAATYRPLRDGTPWQSLAVEAHRWKNRIAHRLEAEWEEFREGFTHPTPTPRTLESETEYTQFLAAIFLRYLTTEETIRPHRNIRDGVANELPPRAYWKRIEKTLRVADEIRHRLGKQLYCINSAYRSPSYNAACPGTAPWSYHMKNQALDLMFTGGSAAAAEVAKNYAKKNSSTVESAPIRILFTSTRAVPTLPGKRETTP